MRHRVQLSCEVTMLGWLSFCNDVCVSYRVALQINLRDSDISLFERVYCVFEFSIFLWRLFWETLDVIFTDLWNKVSYRCLWGFSDVNDCGKFYGPKTAIHTAEIHLMSDCSKVMPVTGRNLKVFSEFKHFYCPTNAHTPHRSYNAAITLTTSARPPCIHIEPSV